MEILQIAAILILSYLLGSIPFGLIVVWIASGKDIRSIESGRTGGTNALRAAGCLAGLITAALDVGKGAASYYLVEWIYPTAGPLLRVAAAILAIVGHNYSIFLLERFGVDGKVRLRGGAGGATCLGGSIALWPYSFFVILPLIAVVYIIGGYASITTMSIAFLSIVVFSIRAALGLSPWVYVLYGVVAELILIWALRPNIKRLRQGNERRVNVFAYLAKKRGAGSGTSSQQEQKPTSEDE